jgi:hypothetical protein
METERKDQRRHPRAKAPQGWLAGWQAGSQRFVSRIEDIAMGGIFMRTAAAVPLQSIVRVVLNLPAGEVQARATVRRVEAKRGIGVEFNAMNQEDRARLSRMVKSLLDIPAPLA